MILRTWMVAWKESIQILRDARSLVVVIVLPVLMLVIYGYAINLDVRHVRLAVYDQDRTRASRDLIGAFTRSERFDAVAELDCYEAVTQTLDDGVARVALVIPVRFSADLSRGRSVPVQVIVDGSDSTTASTAIGYAAAILQQQSVLISLEAVRRTGLATGDSVLPLDARMRFWYNPELKSANFMVPGLIAVILMMLSALLTSMTVVRERERGTIESLIVSPVMPHEVMLGKLAPYVAIAFADVILVIAAGRLLFRVPLLGSPALVLACSAIFLTAALGIGLLVSTLSRNQQTAMTVAMLATQLPSMLLSGFLFPISAMPRIMQLITNIIPARHFLVIVRGIFLKGSGIALVWQPALFLLALGVGLVALSSLRFRKKL
ncbi:MAG: ABC transporter permease [Armatimonadota bacterium]